MGSSSYITNLAGTVSQHIEYLPFGELLVDEHLNSHNSPFKFNAKEFDSETGNYDFGHRYFDPKWSIWLSVDPLYHLAPDKTPYHYVSNNPINRFDPDGLTDYKLLQDGSVERIGDIDDNPDVLFATDVGGNLTDTSLTINDKSLLTQFSEKKKVGEQSLSYAIVGEDSLEDVVNFFEFAVANTVDPKDSRYGIEFGLDAFKENGDVKIAIHTVHEGKWSVNFTNSYEHFGISNLSNRDFLVSIHSHKGGAFTPSDKDWSNAGSGYYPNLSRFIYYPATNNHSKILNQYMHFGTVRGRREVSGQPNSDNQLRRNTLSSQIRRYGKF